MSAMIMTNEEAINTIVTQVTDNVISHFTKLFDKMAKPQKPDTSDEYLTTEKAMAFLAIKSEEGFKAYRIAHNIQHQRAGRGNLYRKSDLIQPIKK